MTEETQLSNMRKRAKLIGLEASRCLDRINNDPNRSSLEYGYYKDGARMFKEIFSIRDKYHALLKEADEILVENVAPEKMPKEILIYVRQPALIDFGHSDKILYDEAKTRITQIIKQSEKIIDILDSLPSSTGSRSGIKGPHKSLDDQRKYDIFICHVSVDKKEIVDSLASALKASGINVWYDDYEIKWGNDIRRTIEKGLGSYKYGIVLLSKNFLDSEGWAQKELSAILNDEGDRLLPIWYKVSHEEVKRRMPIVASIKAERMDSTSDIPNIVKEVKSILSS